MNRDTVIQTVASVIRKDPSVGHLVDLKNYDVMILVESVKVFHLLSRLIVEHHRNERRSRFR
jgi:hypothetical protein